MNKGILIFVLLLLIVILVYYMMGNGSTSLTGVMQDANKSVIISAGDLPANSSGNYSYSVWFYVSNWNYKYGEKKFIIARRDAENKMSPSISLTPISNNIEVELDCYPSADSGGSDAQVHKCMVPNVPIQKWVNLIASVNGRSLDVYLDGKLVKTCVLPGIAKIDPVANVFVTPDGGFEGWTSNIKYWGEPLNPKQAYDVYKQGYGGSVLGNLFNKYRLKIAFVKDNVEQNSFEI